MTIETSQKVTASQLKRRAFLTSVNLLLAKCWSIPRVLPVNTHYGNAPSLWAGRMTKSS